MDTKHAVHDISHFDHIQGIMGFSDIAQVMLHMDTSHLDVTHSENRRIPNHTSHFVHDTSCVNAPFGLVAQVYKSCCKGYKSC